MSRENNSCQLSDVLIYDKIVASYACDPEWNEGRAEGHAVGVFLLHFL